MKTPQFPALLDDSGAFPPSLVRLYAGMLETLYDIPSILMDDAEDVISCCLLLQFWSSVLALGAHLHAPYSEMVKPGGSRAALVQALRNGSGEEILVAYQAAREDGLTEIEDRYRGACLLKRRN